MSRRSPVIEDVPQDDPRAGWAKPGRSTSWTRSTGLDAIGWSADPWDDAEDAGTVERLRVQTRS